MTDWTHSKKTPAASGPVAALATCLLVAAAVLPSLGRLDFFDGVEHFNLATVQEMRRNESAGAQVNWMLPTLQGEARVVKPPLTTWLTATLVGREHVEAIATPVDDERNQAIEQFVAVARLPTLACSCLMLLGVYVLGRALAGGDWRVGAAAALMCAGTVLFFQQGRRATTDLQLSLWVTWTDALLAVAIFQKRRWLGYVGGGLALGLASMAKGPHIALLMTVAPLGVYLITMRVIRRRAADSVGRALPAEETGQDHVVVAQGTQHKSSMPPAGSARPTAYLSAGEGTGGTVACHSDGETTLPDPSRHRNGKLRQSRCAGIASYVPLIAGCLVAAVVGLWWYAYVAGTVPNIWETWRREVLRENAQVGRNIMAADPWYAYSGFFGLVLPWTGWILLGAVWLTRTVFGSGAQREIDDWVAQSCTHGRDVVVRPFQDAPGERRLESPHHNHGHEYMTVPPDTQPRVLLALFWLLLPILAMSFFAEKKDRYLLPFVGPAAVLGAWALVRWWDMRKLAASSANEANTAPPPALRLNLGLGYAAGVFTFAAAAWLSISVAVSGAMGGKGYRTIADQPWFTQQAAMTIGVATLCILAMGVLRSRRTLVAPLLAVTVVAWLGVEMKLRGRAASPGDNDDRPQRELAADIWRQWPNARVYSADPVTLYGQLNLPAIVLSLHLNRVIEPRPATLPTTPQGRPVVLITDSVTGPPATPAGWKRFKVVPLRRGMRYVDVLP